MAVLQLRFAKAILAVQVLDSGCCVSLMLFAQSVEIAGILNEIYYIKLHKIKARCTNTTPNGH